MEIKFNKKIAQSPEVFLRRCGYIPWRDRVSGEVKFIRRLRPPAFYPRFHIFYRYDDKKNLVLNLHLDTRRPMHKAGIRTYESGESEVVQKEVKRIKEILDTL